jgi:hypothetical protein
LELIRTFCDWFINSNGIIAFVVVWFILAVGQAYTLSRHEKGRMNDKVLGRTLLGFRIFGSAVWSFAAIAAAAYAYLFEAPDHYILAGFVGIISVLLWWKALSLGTAIPDRDCGPGG